mmetsp:Transcript_29589/g.41125  ORF Transcript_29589/g.41125 Transcript_29589/m.41125 type:complete len:176 (-) Transcript_29589:82-609(-)
MFSSSTSNNQGRGEEKTTAAAAAVATCEENSCGCIHTGEKGSLKCIPIGVCSVHQYRNAVGETSVLRCDCPANYDGPHCESCAQGYRNYPHCTEDRAAVVTPIVRKEDLVTHPVPQEIEDSKPRFPIMLVYTLTVVACSFVLVTILLHLKKKAQYFSQIRGGDGASVYTFRDDGL